VYRLAAELRLTGWVRNTPAGVLLEVEGSQDALQQFQARLKDQKPANCFIYSSEVTVLDPVGYTAFTIEQSLAGEKSAIVLPDIATCPACLTELFDPANRRFRYPFINCTHCGPRFSIIESLPYDRPHTSMKRFEMCAACRSEYENPEDRRFHAQPNACPVCGPWLELWRKDGSKAAERDDALRAAAQAIREGQVLGLKGIGGFQLLVDARNDQALRRLRQLKNREEKPFALMYPSLARLEPDCAVSQLERDILLSPAAPIVLLARETAAISSHVAPGNPYLGVMLPYSPLHHLLMAELDFPVVATSGNAKDEPICTDEREAVNRLNGFVDLFLVHNRPVVRPVDDSVVRTLMGREAVIRRARGYAPLPVRLAGEQPILGVGAHLKNTVALSVGHQVFVSQHLGDLETPEARHSFENAVAELQDLYDTQPAWIGCDAHPDYESTRYAQATRLPVVEVQHHYAHVLSCMVENDLEPPVLGVSWDGTGYGLDGTVWGGEFLVVNDRSFDRLAHLETFPLPGSERAVREPRRSALGLLHRVYGDEAFERTDLQPLASFTAGERRLLRAALRKGINCPVTSSAGRLFDGAAALAGLRQISTFEGQAAMELEFACNGFQSDESYPIELREPERGGKGPILIDWKPLVRRLLDDSKSCVPVGTIAVRFHNALCEAIVAVARRSGENRVVLSGGCFQNRYLTERAIARLAQEGFRPYWHQRIPPNDGGISLGQVAAVVRERR